MTRLSVRWAANARPAGDVPGPWPSFAAAVPPKCHAGAARGAAVAATTIDGSPRIVAEGVVDIPVAVADDVFARAGGRTGRPPDAFEEEGPSRQIDACRRAAALALTRSRPRDSFRATLEIRTATPDQLVARAAGAIEASCSAIERSAGGIIATAKTAGAAHALAAIVAGALIREGTARPVRKAGADPIRAATAVDTLVVAGAGSRASAGGAAIGRTIGREPRHTRAFGITRETASEPTIGKAKGRVVAALTKTGLGRFDDVGSAHEVRVTTAGRPESEAPAELAIFASQRIQAATIALGAATGATTAAHTLAAESADTLAIIVAGRTIVAGGHAAIIGTAIVSCGALGIGVAARETARRTAAQVRETGPLGVFVGARVAIVIKPIAAFGDRSGGAGTAVGRTIKATGLAIGTGTDATGGGFEGITGFAGESVDGLDDTADGLITGGLKAEFGPFAHDRGRGCAGSGRVACRRWHETRSFSTRSLAAWRTATRFGIGDHFGNADTRMTPPDLAHACAAGGICAHAGPCPVEGGAVEVFGAAQDFPFDTGGFGIAAKTVRTIVAVAGIDIGAGGTVAAVGNTRTAPIRPDLATVSGSTLGIVLTLCQTGPFERTGIRRTGRIQGALVGGAVAIVVDRIAALGGGRRRVAGCRWDADGRADAASGAGPVIVGIDAG
jgi:hypothetical protein